MLDRANTVPLRLVSFLAACGLAVSLAATAQVASAASLYERLGGEAAIRAVVEQFVANNAADDRISHRWASADVPSLKDHLVDMICEAAGGPCAYVGSSMSIAHEGMNITKQEFDWTLDNLAAALDTFDVPDQEKGEVLAVVRGTEADIVGK